YDRRQPRREGQQKRLELADLLVPAAARLVGERELPRRHAEEVEQRGDRAVVQEPEATHLVGEVRRRGRRQREGQLVLDGRHRRAEHADLLVEVALVRHLEVLRQELAGGWAVAPQGRRVAGGALFAVAAEPGTAAVRIEDLLPGLLLRRARAVEVGGGVRRVAHLEDEGAELLHLSRRQLLVHAEQALERRPKRQERLLLVERVRDAAVSVAAPVHRACARHAAEALRGHRTLHGVKTLERADLHRDLDERIVLDRAPGVAQVPREAVEVAEDVAARAGGVA